MATSYMDAYDVTPETFMKVGIKNHNNGSLNEKAQFGAKISTLMEARRASAAKKGLPVPEWKDELAFLMMIVQTRLWHGQCVCTTARPFPTGPQWYCW